MTISFDLDDTLIPGMKRFPTESQRFWHRLVSREKLGAGTLTFLLRPLLIERSPVADQG